MCLVQSKLRVETPMLNCKLVGYMYNSYFTQMLQHELVYSFDLSKVKNYLHW